MQLGIRNLHDRYDTGASRAVHRAAEHILQRTDALFEAVSRHPPTLLHGDFHSQNCFLPGSRGGRHAIFDWQTASSGPAALDVSYHLAWLETSARRASEKHLIDGYQECLGEQGVRGYNREAFMDVYRLGLHVAIYSLVLVSELAVAARQFLDDDQVDHRSAIDTTSPGRLVFGEVVELVELLPAGEPHEGEALAAKRAFDHCRCGVVCEDFTAPPVQSGSGRHVVTVALRIKDIDHRDQND